MLTLIMGLFLSPDGHAADVPVKLQAAIFRKILNYDAAFSQREGRDLSFVVVLDKKTAGDKKGILLALEAIDGLKIGGKTIRVVTATSGNLAASVSGTGAAIIYLPSGSDGATLSQALTVASPRKFPIFAGNEQLTRNGAAVGITAEGGKPRIVVNISSSIAQGMKLPASFLKLCKVVK